MHDREHHDAGDGRVDEELSHAPTLLFVYGVQGRCRRRDTHRVDEGAAASRGAKNVTSAFAIISLPATFG